MYIFSGSPNLIFSFFMLMTPHFFPDIFASYRQGAVGYCNFLIALKIINIAIHTTVRFSGYVPTLKSIYKAVYIMYKLHAYV